jgi:hypothetical protein
MGPVRGREHLEHPEGVLHAPVIGAVGMIFSQAPECRREAHADAVARLVLEPAVR